MATNDEQRARKRDTAERRAAALAASRAQARRRQLLARTGVAAAVVAVLALATFGVARSGTPDKAFQARYDSTSHQLSVSLPTFIGGTVSSAELAGKPTVLNFYASWCQVCDREMPDFQAVHTTLGSKVNFLGVNPQSNDSDEAQAAMVQRTGVRYPTARDHNDDLLRLFNTSGALPTTLFIDASGKVINVHNGGLDQTSLKAAVQQYLGVAA